MARMKNLQKSGTEMFAMDKKPGMVESWGDLVVYFISVILIVAFLIGLFWAADILTGFTDWLVEII
jgi:hypothetical protein